MNRGEGGVQRRFAQWREQMGLTLREVQGAVNEHLPVERQLRSPATISNYEVASKPAPRADFVVALSRAYPELNVDWLLFEDGPMLEVGGREREGGLWPELEKAFPVLEALPFQSKQLFLDVLISAYLADPDRAEPSDSEEGRQELERLAGELLFLVTLPTRWRAKVEAWDFVSAPARSSKKELGEYLVAVLHAVSLALPEPGRGGGGALVSDLRDRGEDWLAEEREQLLEKAREIFEDRHGDAESFEELSRDVLEETLEGLSEE